MTFSSLPSVPSPQASPIVNPLAYMYIFSLGPFTHCTARLLLQSYLFEMGFAKSRNDGLMKGYSNSRMGIPRCAVSSHLTTSANASYCCFDLQTTHKCDQENDYPRKKKKGERMEQYNQAHVGWKGGAIQSNYTLTTHQCTRGFILSCDRCPPSTPNIESLTQRI